MSAKSKCFVATLPDLTDKQFEKLYAWSQNNCERADFVRDRQHGCIRLLALRATPRTQRDFQRLLRTTLLNYGAVLPPRQFGWLKIVDEHDYGNMKLLAAGAAEGKPEDAARDKEGDSTHPFTPSETSLDEESEGAADNRSDRSSFSERSPSLPPAYAESLLRLPVSLLKAC